MSISDTDLTSYASLIVHGGVNLQAGQQLFIQNAPVEAPEIVEAIAEEAYRAGASLVNPLWSYDQLLKVRIRSAPEDSLEEYPHWQAQGLLEGARRGDAFIILLSSDPELLREEDQARVANLVKAAARRNMEFAKMRMSFLFPWTVVSVPTVGWAKRVFPDQQTDEALGRLWEDVLSFCRVGDGDVVAGWRSHVEEIEKRKRTMERMQYRELRLEGPGTDLSVGLPENQHWNGGQVTTPKGRVYSPNIPTEEVFTMPHRDRVEGTVSATRPIYHDGLIVEGLTLRFETGVIVEAHAKTGQELIDRILETDEGSRRLGEVALVSHDTPIAQTNRVYLNGLIDENAASHLAIGQAYPDCIKGGEEMSEEQFRAAGGNKSTIHLDFMVGSPDLDVSAATTDGEVVPILRQGVWVT